jgi:hypothetical protein
MDDSNVLDVEALLSERQQKAFEDRSEIRKRKKDVFDYIVQVWRDHIGKEWIACNQSHQCRVRPKTVTTTTTSTSASLQHPLASIVNLSSIVGSNNNNSLSPTAIYNIVDDTFQQIQHYCTIVNVPAKIYKTVYQNNAHLCVSGYCRSEQSDRARHNQLIEIIDDVYVCANTGKGHYCTDDFCDQSGGTELNSDHQYVCNISGLIRSNNTSEMRHQYWAPEHSGYAANATSNGVSLLDHQQHRAAHAIKRQREEKSELETASNLHNSIDVIMDQIEKGHDLGNVLRGNKRIKRILRAAGSNNIPNTILSPTSLKQEYLYAGILKLSSIFSAERFKADMEKEKETTKELIQQFIKYVNKQMAQKDILNINDLTTIATACRLRKFTTFDMTRLTPTQRKQIILYYAHMCLALWSIMKTKTEAGRTKDNLFPWPEFIDSCLLLFETGCEISAGDNNGHRAVIIEPDPFLAMLRDDSPYLRQKQQQQNGNSSSSNNTEKSRKNKKMHRTCIQTTIKTELINAVTKLKVPIEELRPDRVEYERIDESIFMNRNNNNNRSQR